MTSISWASDELCLYRHVANCSHLAYICNEVFFVNFVKVLERVLGFPQRDLARSNKLRILVHSFIFMPRKVQCALHSVDNLISPHVGSLWGLWSELKIVLQFQFKIMTVAEKFIDTKLYDREILLIISVLYFVCLYMIIVLR